MRHQDMHTAVAPVAWGPPVGGLRLGLSVAGTTVHVHLQNAGHTRLTVLSHVAAGGEIQLDWTTLDLKRAGKTRRVRLQDARNRSAVVDVHLDPGAEDSQAVDVAAWAVRPVNGSTPLAAGTYHLTGVYEVTSSPDHWSGKLEAGPITLTIP